MSQENVEVVRRNYAALVEGFERGDFDEFFESTGATLD
jgi:hypothetical protein